MLKRLLATTSVIALAAAPAPALALSGSQITQQNINPVPNPDGYAIRQLQTLSAPAWGAGMTLGGQLIRTHLWNNTVVSKATVAIGQFHRDGFASPGDGGGANYTPQVGACPAADGGSQLPMADGCAYIDWASVGNKATPQLFGFTGIENTGAAITQDTVAFQAAINTGLTVRFPALTGSQGFTPNNCFTFSVDGQIIEGDGAASQIIAGQNLPAACNGQFQTASRAWAAGPVFSRIRLVYGQPDPVPSPGGTPSRKYLITYLPGFYLRNTPGFRLLSVDCWGATVCVDMKGNSGGAEIDDFHWSAYKIGIDIDGSLDTVNISRPHWFPYFMNANQQTLFGSEGAVVTGQKPGTNTGNGTFVDSPVSNSLNFATLNADGTNYHHVLGTYRFIATSTTAFKLVDPTGVTLATGIPINTPVASYFNYQITAGSTAFAVGDEFDSVVNDIPSIGINSARVDDLKVQNGLFLGGVGLNLFQSPPSATNGQQGGTTGGHLDSVDFDTTSGIIMSAGNITGANITFACNGHAQGLDATGGTLSIGSGFIIEANHDGKPITHFGGSPATGQYTIANLAALDTADIFVIYHDGGELTLHSNHFSRSPNLTYANPVIYDIGGYSTLMGNVMAPIGASGSGTFIYLTDSQWKTAVGNMAVGWGMTLPTGTTMGYYAGNR